MKIIRKGFTNSIGWNLGRNWRSIHLLDPLTSTPINGTNIKKNIDTKNINKENLSKFSWLKDERQKIIMSPKNIKIRCLKKKE